MFRKLLRKCKRAGYKRIGQGASRIVFDKGNGYVMKVAKSKTGIRSNRKEVKMYQSAPRPVKKHLGTIVRFHSGYHWVIMKKYGQPLPKTKSMLRKFYRLRKKMRKNGVYPLDMLKRGRPNYKNVRLTRNRKIVAIDYGLFHTKRSG